MLFYILQVAPRPVQGLVPSIIIHCHRIACFLVSNAFDKPIDIPITFPHHPKLFSLDQSSASEPFSMNADFETQTDYCSNEKWMANCGTELHSWKKGCYTLICDQKSISIGCLYFQWTEINKKCTCDCSPMKVDCTLAGLSFQCQLVSLKSKTAV